MANSDSFRAAKKAFIRQQDASHCGATCLASIIKWFGGEPKISRLLEESGTDISGASLLGLQNSATSAGLEAEGFEADIENLRTVEAPCILHVLKEGSLQHFIVCYEWNNGKFLISDPGEEVVWMNESNLAKIWKSGLLLLVKKSNEFQTAEAEKKEKRNWILALIKEDANILGVALALGVAITFLSMTQAVFVQRLLDDILPEHHLAKLWVGIGLLGFLLLVKAGLTVLRTKFLLKQSRDFNNRIVGRFFGSLLHLPKSFFDSRRTGDLIARLNDTIRIQNAVSYISTNLMIDVLLVLMCLLFILMYSPWLFFIALIILPLYFFVVRIFHKSILTSQRELMASYARNESHYVDTIQGIWPIKAGNREKYYAGITKLIYDFFQANVLKLGEVSMRFNFLAEISSSLVFVGVLALGAILQLNGHIEIGGFIAVVYMIQMMLPASGRLALLNIQLQEARVAFDRMYEFTSLVPEYDEESDRKKTQLDEFHSLEIKNLSFGFPAGENILEDVNIEIKKGSCYALFGESGSGKSTLLQVLQKFYSPRDGQILVNGINWNDTSIHSWRNLIGVVPQQVKIFSGTLAENISLDELNSDPEHWKNFLEKYGFEKYFLNFPQGLNTRLGEGGINLSGGQQQLVGLARALYRNPQILLLDESTAAMDRNTEDFVIGLIDQLKSNTAILIVSHRIRSIKNCERIYVLKNGKTEISGTHEQLIHSDNLYGLSWKDYSA